MEWNGCERWILDEKSGRVECLGMELAAVARSAS
jgi:hypothetical protein